MHSLLVRAVPIVALLTGLSLACTPAAPPTTPTPAAADAQAQREQENKALVTRVYSELFAQTTSQIAGELFSADAVHHDQRASANGPAGEIALMQALKANTPGLLPTVKHAAADGDLVAVHWQASATPDKENTGQAVVDLYRLAGGKIVEHWDVVPAQQPS